MKKIFLTALPIMMISTALLAASPAIPLDRVAVILNSAVILDSEVNVEIARIKKQLQAENTAFPPPEVLRKQVLEQIINKKLQLQLAEQAGLNPTDAEIDKAITSIAKSNHLTVPQLYTELEKRGTQKTQYRHDIHDEYIIQQVQQQAIAAKITVSDQEVDDYMRSAAWLASTNKEYHLEDILVATPEAPSSQDIQKAEARANTLLKRIQAGLPFHEAAASESNSTDALQGGDLGWRKLPEVPGAFASYILQAKDGDLLGPISASNGFHILHVAGIRQVEMANNATDTRHKIKRLIFERKYAESLQAWLTKIRSEAFINMNPETSA